MTFEKLFILWRIAWRNLWRQTRRTFLTVGTVALGLALMLISLGLGDGSHEQMIDSAVRMGSGHVLFQAEGYQELAEIDLTLSAEKQEQIESWLSDARDSLAIQDWVRRAFASGLGSSADGSAGIQLIAVEPEDEAAVSIFGDRVTEGQFLQATDSGRVVIGKGVAQNLEVEVDDKIVIMAQPAEGTEIASKLVRIGGIVETGLEDYDQVLLLMKLEEAQDFLSLGSSVHQVALYLSSSAPTERVVDRASGHFSGVEIVGWYDALPELRDAILVDDGGNYVFQVFIFLLIAFTVMNTLLMSVLERSREFSLLDALGLSPQERFWMVITEGFLISVLANCVGFSLGYAGHLYLHHYGLPMDLFVTGEMNFGGVMIDPILYSELSQARIVWAILIVFLLTLVLSLLPALRASRTGDVRLLGNR